MLNTFPAMADAVCVPTLSLTISSSPLPIPDNAARESSAKVGSLVTPVDHVDGLTNAVKDHVKSPSPLQRSDLQAAVSGSRKALHRHQDSPRLKRKASSVPSQAVLQPRRRPASAKQVDGKSAQHDEKTHIPRNVIALDKQDDRTEALTVPSDGKRGCTLQQPPTPNLGRLPTPDLSDLESDDYWCCKAK